MMIDLDNFEVEMEIKKKLDERKFGLWWGIDYWLVRTRETYDDMKAQRELFEELFGEPVDNWEKMSKQLRKVFKEMVV